MNKKIYVLSFAVALTLALVALISGFAGHSAASPSNNALTALPASDIVITIDTQRLLSETLPTVLADNPTLLAKVNEKIERCNREMGIDPRTFDSVAVGLRFKSSSDDFDAVVIARGHFISNEVIDAGFTAAEKKGEFQKREELYEGKTIFVVTPQRQMSTPQKADGSADSNTGKDDGKAEAPTGTTTNAVALKAQPAAGYDNPAYQAEMEANRRSEQMAVVALDANTIAAGDLKSVKAAIDASLGRERVDDELVRMATQNPSALVGFSGKIPASVTEKMAKGRSGREAQYFASIREFYGSFSTTGTDAETFVAVRTENASQAHDISQALNAMKMLSGFGMTQAAKGEARSVAELLKDLSITAQDNEVRIKLNIKQKDLAPLVRELK